MSLSELPNVCHLPLKQIRELIPQGMSRDKWQFMIDWTGVGIPNCFSSPNEVINRKEFQLFQQQLADRLRQPMDEKAIDWIWDRMRATSNTGASGYADRYRPTGSAYEEGIPAYR
jgi:hypothetical protein